MIRFVYGNEACICSDFFFTMSLIPLTRGDHLVTFFPSSCSTCFTSFKCECQVNSIKIFLAFAIAPLLGKLRPSVCYVPFSMQKVIADSPHYLLGRCFLNSRANTTREGKITRATKTVKKTPASAICSSKV